ncbi:uncharacterized protein [Clytia hemisphaerica]|uniref:uncharacterized protein n=1 Tax=Clytia hemisphaerica TaxID=252671 RepID=UPI0034D4B79A
MDGVTAPNSWIEPRRRYINKMTEFQDSTYLANPISAVIADFNYCFNQDGCEFANPTNFRSDRASLPFSTIQDGLQMPSEPFRIKFKEQGYCWTLDKTSGYNQLILSSKCHDVFSLGRYQFPAHPFSLWHIETGLRVERHGNANNDGNDIHLGSQETDEGETFISRMKCMMIINSWSRASCVYPNGNRLMLKGGRDHITQENPCKFPGVDTRSNYLPDYSAHYNVLNMKNVLQTTLPDGSKILLVCDPKRDL